MAKNKSKDNSVFNLIGLVLLVVALILWFILTPIKYESGGMINIESTISYIKGTFGMKTEGIVSIELLKFSFLNLIPLLIIALGALLSLFAFLQPKALKESNFKILTHILMIAGIVMLLLFKQFLVGASSNADFSGYKLTFQAFVIPVLLLANSILQFLKK